jgi:hypothetical protein
MLEKIEALNMAVEGDRVSVTVGDLKGEIESFRNDSAWRELSLAGKIRSMVRDRIDSDPRTGGRSETFDLLVEFVNYLIDHSDHDGYSLSEISGILGRPSDKGLVDLVQKLQAKDSKRGSKTNV